MTQLGLIHDKEKTLENENVIRKDTAYIFQKFDGATIVFSDCDKITFQSDLKKINVPKSYLPNGKQDIQSLKLSSLNFNISIQKKTENTTDQQEINKAAFAAFENTDFYTVMGEDKQSEYNGIKTEILNSTQLSKEQALKLTRFLRANVPNLAFGVNCYSGKDRTGAFIAELAKEVAEYNLKKPVPSMGLLRGESLAVAVADYNYANPVSTSQIPTNVPSANGAEIKLYENTKISVLKVKPVLVNGTIEKIAVLWSQFCDKIRGSKVKD
jgi:hypothetical protein